MTKKSKKSKKPALVIKKPAKKQLKKVPSKPGKKQVPVTPSPLTPQQQNLIAIYISPRTQEVEFFFKELLSLNAGKILVVDDSENLKHKKLYKDLGLEWVIFYTRHEGLEKSMAAIAEQARKSECQFLVVLEARTPLWLEYLNHFIDEAHSYEVVSGSQYLDPQLQTDMPNLPEATLNKIISHLLHRHTGLRISDAFAPYKAFKIKALEKINFKNIKFFPVHFWFAVAKSKPRFSEIPIPLAENNKSKPKNKLPPPEQKLGIYLKMIEDAAKKK